MASSFTTTQATLQAAINAVDSNTAAEQLLLLAISAAGIDGNVSMYVDTLDSLPSAASYPNGVLVFVNSIKLPVMSYNNDWVGLDGRRADKANYRLWTWGSGGNGRLGDGTGTTRSSPGTTAGGGVNWSMVAAGYTHTMAIKSDGSLWATGDNSPFGYALGDGTTTARSSPVTVAGGGTWTTVSAGRRHSAGIKTDGTLWSWGYNTYGSAGNGVGNASSPVTVLGGGTWSQISCGIDSSAGIKTDGTLWTWGGQNDSGQNGNGTNIIGNTSPLSILGGGNTWSKISVALGSNMAAVKTDGTLWTWGANGYGQLGNGTTTGSGSPITTAGGGTTWSQVKMANGHAAAVKTDGTLWTWGRNNNGQLGDGTTNNRSSPGTVAGGGTTWVKVSGGGSALWAIKTDATLWSWGANSSGQLGNGTTTSRSSPGLVVGNLAWVTLGDIQSAHAAAIDAG